MRTKTFCRLITGSILFRVRELYNRYRQRYGRDVPLIYKWIWGAGRVSLEMAESQKLFERSKVVESSSYTCYPASTKYICARLCCTNLQSETNEEYRSTRSLLKEALPFKCGNSRRIRCCHCRYFLLGVFAATYVSFLPGHVPWPLDRPSLTSCNSHFISTDSASHLPFYTFTFMAT